MVRFRWREGDSHWREFGGEWISNRIWSGEFSYWMVIRAQNWEDILGSPQKTKYLVALYVVAPDQVLAEERKKAYYYWGAEMGEMTDEQDVEIMLEHGAAVFIQEWEGNNRRLVIREAKKKAREVEAMFGFYMDQPVNAIGTTGWEALQGDILAGLRRTTHDG